MIGALGALGGQEAVVAVIVLGAVAWLVRRQVVRRKKRGCGCEGCPGAEKLAADRREAAVTMRRRAAPKR